MPKNQTNHKIDFQFIAAKWGEKERERARARRKNLHRKWNKTGAFEFRSGEQMNIQTVPQMNNKLNHNLLTRNEMNFYFRNYFHSALVGSVDVVVVAVCSTSCAH